MRTILGSFRLLRRRAQEIGQPGLGIWADAGEQATTAIQRRVAHEAFVDETCDAEAERALEAVLKDGRIEPGELEQVAAALRNVKRSRAAAQRIGEVVS